MSAEAIWIRHAKAVGSEPGWREPVSLLLREGRIERILPEKAGGTEGIFSRTEGLREIDAAGALVLPGPIDPHVHFRDPGFTAKEDLGTGAAAARHGGFTSVVMMGNTNPHPDVPERVEAVLARAAGQGTRIYTCGNVTVGMAGRELTDFEALRRAGAVLLSDDGLPILDAALMEQACERAADLDMVLSLHEEDPAFIEQPGIHRGAVAASLGFGGAGREAEVSMVERDIRIAERTGARITIQHISARESVALVRGAKARGVRVYAEATPHHFTLEAGAVRRFGTNAKMNPPLREEEDRQAIIEGLRDGTIDMITTDHAPHTQEEKAREFALAPSGIIGLETALSLVLRELVLPGYLGWEQAVERLTAAYRIYGLSGGTLGEGAPADLVIFDPEASWTVAGHLCSKARNTPFLQEELPGVVRYTICGGSIVYTEEEKNDAAGEREP